jgi:hypothetical protein
MNVNFKFGEHFYQGDEFSWMVSLLITLIGTFIGFFLALLLDRSVDNRNRKRKEAEEVERRLDVLKYLKSILDALSEYIPKQTERIAEFSDQLKKNALEIVYPEILATYDLIRLRNADNVNTQEAYRYFFENTENPFKDYKNLFAHGDYLNREMESIERQTERAISFKHKDQLVVRDIVEELSFVLLTRIQDLISDYGSPALAMKDDEYKFLDNLAEAYGHIIQTMMVFQKVRDDFINPIMVNAMSKIQDNKVKVQVLELARKAHSRLINIEANSNHFAEDIGGLEARVKDALEYIKKESDKIQEKIVNHDNG